MVGTGTALAQHGLHPRDEALLSELPLTDVDRQGRQSPPGLQPHQCAAGLLDHPVTHAHDQAGRLGNGNEFGRGYRTALRMLPAHQQLSSHHRASTIDLGLNECAELRVSKSHL